MFVVNDYVLPTVPGEASEEGREGRREEAVGITQVDASSLPRVVVVKIKRNFTFRNINCKE